MAAVTQVQVRCARCNRRLADFVNEIDAGWLIVELKGLRCGERHLEMIRAPASSAAVGIMPDRLASVVEVGHS